MIKGFIAFFAIILVRQASLASIVCSTIFNPTLKQVLHHIHPDYVPQSSHLSQYFGARREIQKILNRANVNQIYKEEQLIEVHRELVDLIWKVKKPKTFMAISEQLIQDAIIRQRLLEYWGPYFLPRNESSWALAKQRFGKFLRSPLGQAWLLPFVLPRIYNKEVPQDLANAIIRSGIRAHLSRLAPIVDSQSKIESYKVIRAYYTPLVLSMAFGFYYTLALEHTQQKTDEWFNATLEALQSQNEYFENQWPSLKEELIEQAILDSYIEFEVLWGEPPTEDEKRVLSEQIRESIQRPKPSGD